MNYFELFDLPISFSPDKTAVSKKYFSLQKEYHPDFYTQTTEAEKESALETSAMANKAYKTFQNQNATIKYILQLKGLLEEEEKYTLPPAFLMEVLELNEMKMDGAAENDIRNRTAQLQKEIYAGVQTILENYDDATSGTEELLQVKEYYYKNQYLRRLLQDDL